MDKFNININCEKNNNIRLNKAIAASGLFSRRKADELILSGRVAINDHIEINPATKVSAQDRINIDGKPLSPSPAPLYLLLNKPVQTVCTLRDPQGRKTIMDLLPAHYRNKGLFPVGRLDYFSEGAILLTNDGELANKLMHPRYEKEKVYEVTTREKPSESMLKKIREGLLLNDGTKLLPVQVNGPKPDKNGNYLLTMTLRQGINRQIRKMCADLKLTILKLIRIQQGVLKLDNLPPGKLRELSPSEIIALKSEDKIK